MHVKLIVVAGKANKAEVKLRLPARIGRGRESDLAIAHPTVSRRHCEIVVEDGKIIVRDMGSLNSTLIDGKKVSEGEITAESRLTIGPLTFQIVPRESTTDAPPAAKPASPAVASAAESPADKLETKPIDASQKPLAQDSGAMLTLGDDSDLGLPSIDDSGELPVSADAASGDDLAFDWLELEEEPEPPKKAAPKAATKPAPEPIPLAKAPNGSEKKAPTPQPAAAPQPSGAARQPAKQADDDIDSFFKDLGID